MASPAPQLLARADSEPGLPRLGGMARPDGVVIVSEHFWAFAGRDGSLREGRMPASGGRLRNVPFVRGLIRLASSLSPLLRRRGVAGGRERWLLTVALVAPFGFFLLPDSVSLGAGIALTAGLLGWLLRGRTLFLHGAEHRAIAAAEERRLVAAWTGAARPTRFSSRCGTNFAALVLPVSLVAERVWPLSTAVWTPFAVALVSLALSMELWLAVQAAPKRVARFALLPGLTLQRLTTREPRLGETRIALRAVESVLARELGAR